MPKQRGKKESQKPPRHHHYIPSFFLEGFTASGSKDDYLFVLDIKQKKMWRAKSENAAHQRDFYRVKIPGVEPNLVEKTFGHFENQAAFVIKKIIKKRELPEDDDFIVLINFVALMAVRIPRYRSVFDGSLEKMNKFRLKLMTAHPKRWAAIRERMKKNGYDIDDKVSYEAMKGFVERDNYSIKVSQEWHIKNLLDSMDILIPLLVGRKWSLFIVQNDNDEFICSDSPVALEWTKPVPPFWGPGFGMKYTELTMPLNKHIAILGSFEEEPQTFRAPKTTVAKLNSRTIMYAQRFIYSSVPNIIWFKGKGEIGNTRDLMIITKAKNKNANSKKNQKT